MTLRTSLILICTFISMSVPGSAEVQDAMNVARELGMSDQAIEDVKSGKVVIEELEASSDKDLSIALVARIDAPLEKVHEFLSSGRLLEISAITQSFGEIDTSTFSMAEMKLSDDLLAQLADDPEDTFFMSEEELAAVTEASKQGASQVLSTYQAALSARAKAYWAQGLDGIAPYAGKDRSPKVDLDDANKATRKFIHNKAIRDELDATPSGAAGKAQHRLGWAIQKGHDQAAPVLTHRVLYAESDGQVSVERRFYSGYDYDALQIVAAILPTSDQSCLVFYLNHTYTAQVAGFGGSAKRSIGRKLMQKALVAELEAARAAIQRN